MTRDELNQARDKYQEIINGRASGWFYAGEYEALKQTWFDSFAAQLLGAVEMHNELAMERDEYE